MSSSAGVYHTHNPLDRPAPAVPADHAGYRTSRVPHPPVEKNGDVKGW